MSALGSSLGRLSRSLYTSQGMNLTSPLTKISRPAFTSIPSVQSLQPGMRAASTSSSIANILPTFTLKEIRDTECIKSTFLHGGMKITLPPKLQEELPELMERQKRFMTFLAEMKSSLSTNNPRLEQVLNSFSIDLSPRFRWFRPNEISALESRLKDASKLARLQYALMGDITPSIALSRFMSEATQLVTQRALYIWAKEHQVSFEELYSGVLPQPAAESAKIAAIHYWGLDQSVKLKAHYDPSLATAIFSIQPGLEISVDKENFSAVTDVYSITVLFGQLMGLITGAVKPVEGHSIAGSLESTKSPGITPLLHRVTTSTGTNRLSFVAFSNPSSYTYKANETIKIFNHSTQQLYDSTVSPQAYAAARGLN